MREPRRETQVFLVSFCLSLIVLGALSLLMLFVFKLASAPKESGRDAALLTPDTVETESLSLLLIGCDSLAEPPPMIWFVSYDGKSGAVTATILPPDTLSDTDERSDTLSGHYTYGGIFGLRRAVGALTGQMPDRYLRLEREGLSALADWSGGLDASFEDSFLAGKEQFLPGKQHLTGRKLAALLLNCTPDGKSDCEAQKKWGQPLCESLLSGIAKKPDDFFDTLFSYGETNLSRYDILLRKEHFERTAVNRERVAVHIEE